MKTKKKWNMKRTLSKIKSKNTSKNKRGGLLTMTPETDLINTHICNVNPEKPKDSPGLEILTSFSQAYQLNEQTVKFLIQEYKSNHGKWFKFVIFKNNDVNYIYFITGAQTNKHSVCMLEGILDATKDTGEYDELRKTYNSLLDFKKNYGDISRIPNELKNECYGLIDKLSQLIERDIKCMPVIAAGSGSINGDNSICINNKSGHYKPTTDTMAIAKQIFEEITGSIVNVKEKEDKKLLLSKYKENYEDYTGICL